ncbi:hypothetical protein FLM9_733 [Candidatus Synechococcus spongiarum]|uniref:Uncharacterized protein n=1 Tax=Candidatus Synechococcus spongiarum TaxID=431041 RepID=A0A164Z4M9_9SYNE|nr:hypothetical protein FLM9_733 [Candidatus Synechococcus spongiarum]
MKSCREEVLHKPGDFRQYGLVVSRTFGTGTSQRLAWAGLWNGHQMLPALYLLQNQERDRSPAMNRLISFRHWPRWLFWSSTDQFSLP